jgi:UDP-N-acetylmuramoylalanine--D-glutamate ligase
LQPIGAAARRTVRLHLGSNDVADVAQADLVCPSQGVPASNPMLVEARRRGLPVRSMTTLFLDLFPGPVLGITGSSGKTTTTALMDAIFTAAGREHVSGGNIGHGLLSLLGGANASTWGVLEISHTQLVLTERSPQVAALLRVTPNHLDQFTWEQYVELKRKIFAFQGPDGVAVFNADDPVTRELMATARGETLLFSVEGDHGRDGAYLWEGRIFWRRRGNRELVLDASEIPLRGFHNVANVTGAAAIAAACDIGPEAVATAVREFKAPEHRLEFVATVRGVSYYNDSIATAPERTLAALRSFEEPVVLLLGGRDKNLPMEQMLEEAAKRCRAVICFGEAGVMLAAAAERAGLRARQCASLSEAVEEAQRLAQIGDVVLLSPACTSFDAYDNFEQRGIDFRRLVGLLPG